MIITLASGQWEVAGHPTGGLAVGLRRQDFSQMQRRFYNNYQGFTLIEIIAVLVIGGLLTSIAAAKVFENESAVIQKAVVAAATDLNSRERLSWSKIKLSGTSWLNDDQVFTNLDTQLGPGYTWHSIASTGGILNFKGLTTTFIRTPSTSVNPGVWVIP